MMIDAHTKLYSLIGEPVCHSASPAMHNSAFQKVGINAVYLALEVSPGNLKEAVLGLKTLSCGGFNVTFPHKVRVMDYLDEVSQEARSIGAVNTVKNIGGKLKGYNTDGQGFAKSFEDNFGEPIKGKSVMLAGCGGAGSAIAVQGVLNGIKSLVITDTDENKIKELKDRIKKINPALPVSQFLINDTSLEQAVCCSDVLVDATPLGMKSDDPPSIFNSWIERRHFVCDLVYHPATTPLIERARMRRAKYMNGFGMLLYQGALAFEIWTDAKAPIEVMRKALKRKVYHAR